MTLYPLLDGLLFHGLSVSEWVYSFRLSENTWKLCSNFKEFFMSKFTIALVGSLGLVAASISSAFAALPAAVGTAVTAMQTDGQGIFDLVFPVVAVLVGLGVVIKLFKRFSNKV